MLLLLILILNFRELASYYLGYLELEMALLSLCKPIIAIDFFFFTIPCSHANHNNLFYNLFCCYIICLYSENAGLLALTRVGSRRVVQISAGFMIFFSILGVCAWVVYFNCSFHVHMLTKLLILAGKFGAVFASIPAPIVAALYCLFFAYVGMSK